MPLARPRIIGLIACAAAALGGCAMPTIAPRDLMGRWQEPAPRPAGQAFADIPYASWTDDEPDYRFFPGDELEVSVPSAPELSKSVTVQPDGRIALPLIGGSWPPIVRFRTWRRRSPRPIRASFCGRRWTSPPRPRR